VLVDTTTRKPTPLPPTTIEKFQRWMMRGENAAG
jgi:acyl-CoA thioesterase FadM